MRAVPEWVNAKGKAEMKLTDFKALAFDCYGTLIDWETGMIEGLH